MKIEKNGSLKIIIERVIYAAIIALIVFTYRINAKVDTIVDNKASIGKLWQNYGKLDGRMDKLVNDIGELRGRHMQ